MRNFDFCNLYHFSTGYIYNYCYKYITNIVGVLLEYLGIK